MSALAITNVPVIVDASANIKKETLLAKSRQDEIKKNIDLYKKQIRTSPTFRRVVKMCKTGRECYTKHGDAHHGFINQNEETLNQIASSEMLSILALDGVDLLQPRRHTSDRFYIRLDNVEVTG